MNDAPFSAELSAALDAYVVPPLPPGFTGRLLARVHAPPGQPPKMRPTKMARRNPWARAGRFALAISSAGFIAATAAAAGIFGEPAYIPVISDVLIQAKIVDAPAKSLPRRAAVAPAISASPETAVSPTVQTGSAKVKTALQSLARDPAFRALPPAEKLRQAIKINRDLIRSGQATPKDVRRAIAEIRAETPEATKIERRELIRERVEDWRKRRQQPTPPGPLNRKDSPPAVQAPGAAGDTSTTAAAGDTSNAADPASETQAEQPESPPPGASPPTREERRRRVIDALRKSRSERQQ